MLPTSRILADRRLIVSVLGLLAALNVVGLFIVFGPLRSRVHTLEQRATNASLTAATATRELATARQTAAGSERAVTDLARFHTQVLPANQPAARQVTFVRLAQLARASNLSYDQRSFAQDAPVKDGTLVRATLTMDVYGTYRDLRRFIHGLEIGDEFVVIRQLAVSQGEEPGEPLKASLTLSTYFKGSDGR